jgi:hypothetical protein
MALLSSEIIARVAIGAGSTFGSLKKAQALGDFYSLSSRGLRALQIHLGRKVEKDLKRLCSLLIK